MGINHLGHFLLTNLLLDIIVKSGKASLLADKAMLIMHIAIHGYSKVDAFLMYFTNQVLVHELSLFPHWVIGGVSNEQK